MAATRWAAIRHIVRLPTCVPDRSDRRNTLCEKERAPPLPLLVRD